MFADHSVTWTRPLQANNLRGTPAYSHGFPSLERSTLDLGFGGEDLRRLSLSADDTAHLPRGGENADHL
ncbi:hypothetical protein ACVWZZ_004427 [Bradyrhizobium sp. LM6.10]